MTTIQVEALQERVSDLEEERDFWRERAEEFRDSAVKLAEEASKCLVLAYEQHVAEAKHVGLSA